MSRHCRTRCKRLLSLAMMFAGLIPCVTKAADLVKRPVQVEDLYLFNSPTTPVLSPDGKRMAYIREWVEKTTRQERRSLWIVEGTAANARTLENGEPDARSPVFSPDGKWIAFRSTRPRPEGFTQTPPAAPESDPATDIWLIRAEGGSAIPLDGPEKPYGRVLGDPFYSRLAFSPDGKQLVFVADDGRGLRTAEEIDADVDIVRPDQGEGYTGYRPAQIWVADLAAEPGQNAATKITRLTDDDVWYGDPQWSPDAKSIVVHANRTNDRESVRFSINKNFDLWAITVADRSIRQLTTGPGPEVSPRFSADGKRLLCLSIPRKGPHSDIYNLAVVSLADQSATTVVYDHHLPRTGLPPHPSPFFPLPDACWENSDAVVYTAARGTGAQTIRLDLKSGSNVSLDPQSAARPDSPTSQQFARIRELTPAGNRFLEDRVLAENKLVRWKNGDLELEGVLTVPPPSVAKAPYKLLVYPHGGPHSRSMLAFNFVTEVFAGQGYLVFQPNFRGSQGYDKKFLDADRADFGGGDMRDILTGIDSLIEQGLVDRDRQFVYGISYGGYMTSWLVTQTNRFKAAVAQNAVTDLDVMWGLSDLSSWTEWELGGYPWDVPEAMRRHSPFAHVAKVQTPTLILHARDDRRCPIAMGRMFHNALHARGVPTQMVIYPNEGHGIRQPRHREDVLRRTLAWFAEHGK